MKKPPSNLRAYWSIPEVAARLGISQVKVRRWLAAGELGQPINVALHTRGRPRLMVSIKAVEAFEQRRLEPVDSPVQQRRRQVSAVPEYVK